VNEAAVDTPVTKKTPRWRRWLVEILIFAGLFLAFQAWQLRDAARGPAPTFVADHLDGTPFDLAAWRAEHPGRAVLL